MRRFSHRITQQHLLLFLSLLLGAVNSNTTEPTVKSATTTIAETITESTTANPPQNTDEFTQVAQNETSVTLRWQKSGNFLHYVLRFDGQETNFIASAEASHVEHTVSGLTSGTEYVATLFTVSGSVRSSGVNLTAVTAPQNADEFTQVAQNETSVTLRWQKSGNVLHYVLWFDGQEINVTASAEASQVEHTVPGLTSGTKYDATLFTVLEGIRSSGVNLTAVTAPENADGFTQVAQNETSVTLRWQKAGNFLHYVLWFDGQETNVTASAEASHVEHTVPGLTSGTKHHVTLFTVFESVISSGVNLTAVTAPENAEGFTQVAQNETSVTLRWQKAGNFLHYVLWFDGQETNVTASAEASHVEHTVPELTSGTKYDATLFTVFESIRSSGVNLTAVTAPENAEGFTQVAQNETSVTLRWQKAGNFLHYVLWFDGQETNVTASAEASHVEHTVPELTSGTKYDATLFTVFESVRSSGVNLTAVTAPENAEGFTQVAQNETSVTLRWQKAGNFLHYVLWFDGQETNVTASAEASHVEHTVPELTSGNKYVATLFTVFESIRSSGVNLTAVTAPENADEFTQVAQNETSVTLRWQKSGVFLHYVLWFNGDEINVTASAEASHVEHTVPELTSGTKYVATLFTVLEGIRSSGVNLTAFTAPENAEEFKQIAQNETSVTLRWKKEGNFLHYVLWFDEKETNITASAEASQVEHTVLGLISGTKHHVTLFTVFESVRSSGVNLTAVTAPENVNDITVQTQNESSITLSWSKVKNILMYILEYTNGTGQVNDTILATSQDAPVTHVVSLLSFGTKYTFTLFTVFEGVRSTGYKTDAATVPPMVPLVNVTARTVTGFTLVWENMNDNWNYSVQINGGSITVQPDGLNVLLTTQSLDPGTEYPFSVTTLFFGLYSSPYKNFTVTAIDCASVAWRVTTSTIQGAVEGLFSNAIVTNGSQTHVGYVGRNVSFTGLYPGATYNLYLVYEKDSMIFLQCAHNLTMVPSGVGTASCNYWAAGYSVFIVWGKPEGVWTAVEVTVAGKSHKVYENKEQHLAIPGFLPARTYEVSIRTLSGAKRSDTPLVFACATDPRGVIAGSVFAVLLFFVLVGLLVFVLLKRPDIISKKRFVGGSKLSSKALKDITAATFPNHFHQLSLDNNRLFSMEYEDMASIGVEQTNKVASLPENRAKNRYTNVLPYDWCRVKLMPSLNRSSDYINASYIPGYTGNQEYIATQGPLPSTVCDFWMMIWEQKVKGIVMVTNCVEVGRTKCEQYWPADGKSCLHGELMVFCASEQKESHWTLREFRLEHRSTSEERMVTHFHFTAWPDHGVPHSPDVLIQFRELFRGYIDRQQTEAPTVVHCSAGVGRTGTIIALDVLLQQLYRERSVGVRAFVQKMRLRRRYMVQTDSQYVFLHQCIMDTLQPYDTIEENIYENTDNIYVNATALKQFVK